VTTCKDEINRTFFGGRCCFHGPQDSWYVRGLAFTESQASSNPCNIDTPRNGAVPIVGDYWLWDSGFNLDLGLRPGLLALGFSF
jgi:hypothetical protein